MNRLMGFARNLGSETREACRCFPLTMSAVFLVGILACVLEKTDWLSNQILENGEFFFFLFSIGSFLTETLFLRKVKEFWYAESIVLAVSLFGTFLFYLQAGVSILQKRGIVWGGIGRYLTGYCLILIIISIYIWYRRSGLRTEEYCIKVFQQFGKITLTFVLISLGCLILSRIFSSFILGRKDLKIADTLFGLIITIFYVPSLSMIWRKQEEITGVFVERMIKFVFLPISVVSGIIMYLYLIKLLIPFTIPSNQIFRIMTVLFIGGMIIWTLLGYYEEDSWYMKMAEKLPYFYLPFLLVQGYALGIRLASYGMTPNRFLGIMMVLFEFLYLCFYRMMKDRVGNILPVYAVLIFLATWMPGVNLQAVSIRNQKSIAEQVYTIPEDELNKNDWKRIYGAYEWLAEQPECIPYMASTFSDDVVEKIQMNSGLNADSLDGIYWLYDSGLVHEMDVSTYHTVNAVHSVNNQDITRVIFQNNGDDNTEEYAFVLNLQTVFDTYIQYYQENGFERSVALHEKVKKHNVFILSDQETFVVDSIEVILNKEKMEISKYSISGYLLVK